MNNLIKCLIIFSICLQATLVNGENIGHYKTLLDSLIKNNQLIAAKELTQRMLLFADDSVKKELHFKEGIILMKLELPYEAYQQFHLVYEDKYSNNNERSQAIVYTSICYVQMEEYGTALHFLEAYPIEENWKTTKNVIAGYCNYLLKDYKSAKEYFYFAGLNNYEALFKKDLKMIERLKVVAIISSAILPGMGQTLLGKPIDGATALMVNFGFGLLALRANSVSVLGALIFATPLFMRYYIGNITRTKNFADDKIKKYKKNNIKKMLSSISN